MKIIRNFLLTSFLFFLAIVISFTIVSLMEPYTDTKNFEKRIRDVDNFYLSISRLMREANVERYSIEIFISGHFVEYTISFDRIYGQRPDRLYISGSNKSSLLLQLKYIIEVNKQQAGIE